MTHHVFAPLDDSNLVVKVFETSSREEPEHEWDALVTLAGSGIAPEPVHFEAGDPAIVVMTRVSGSSLPAGAIGAEHAREIGRAHRLVHRMVPEVRRPPSHSGVWAARAALTLDDRHESYPRESTPQTWLAEPGERPKPGSQMPTLNISCTRTVFLSHAAIRI